MSEEDEKTTLLGPGTWTQQGPATLVVREAGWVVLVPGLRKEVTEAAWTVLGENPAPEEFLDKLVEAAELESADKLTAILFGFLDGTTGTFGVKGKTPIAVYTPEGSIQIAGTDEEPFVLKTLEDVRRTAFGDLPAEESVGAPRVAAGIARVRGFVHVTVDPAELDEDARAALAEQVENDGRSIEDPEAKKRRAERPKPAPQPAASSTSSSGSSGSSDRRPMMATRKPGEMPPSVSGGATPAASAASEPADSGPNMFDDLFADKKSEPEAPGPPAAPAPSEPAEPVSKEAAPSSPAESAEASTTSVAASAAPADPAPPPRSAESAEAGRRRLVSTSLFDRRRSSRPAGAEPQQSSAAGPPDPSPEVSAPEPSAPQPSAPQEPAPAPSAPDAPERLENPGSSSVGTDPSDVTIAPDPSSSIPTPEPPDDDEFESPPTQIAPIDDGEGPEDDEPAASPSAPRPRPAAVSPPPDLENTGAYDDLFGKTVFRRIEDAAVRRSEEDEDGEAAASEDPAALAEEPAQSPTTAEPEDDELNGEPEPAAPEPATDSHGDFIDWVPGVGRTAPEIAQAAARRATEKPRPEPAYPQVQMAERPPAPQTGSRPAAVRPDDHRTQSPPAPAPGYGGQGSGGYAGQQVGYPSPPQGAGPQYGNAPVDPAAAGHQVGFPGAPMSGAPAAGDPRHAGYAGPPGYSAPSPGSHHRGAYPSQQPPAPGASAPSSHAPGVPTAQPAGAGAGRPRPPAPPPGSAPPATPAAPGAPTAGPGHPAGGAVALPGLVCQNGHANPPERSQCRACGAPLQGATRTVARPPLGVVESSTGERFVLDRTAIIGRRPRASRVSGNDVPQLITVPSPQQDISRSHLELRLEGWHVVAVDLGATNGTTLHRAGTDPVRLRPREGVVLHDGDRLDLGDGVHLLMRERV
ncbi:FHA domain-containing protein [Brachybacterium sp. GCM10030252]|uniref:FHA domain-containing protein n=1 Tax=Brachybacterium sp. GCM10030252 TaxID=3273380 RepID=UPI003608D469